MSRPNSTHRPLISFVVIAFNEADKIGRTITSILEQDGLESYELITVNDGSTDDTSGVIKTFAGHNPHIRPIEFEKNRGRGAGRYAGVKAARGLFIAFVDADITLPKHWLSACLREIEGYDAVGGTAVPDGDVAYLFAKFALTPKKVAHSTTVTGSNGLFRAGLFDQITFDPNLKEGEDVAFNHALTSAGARSRTVPNLTVVHTETKNYRESLRWLYQSGLGAARQLRKYRQVRLPDIAFFGFLGLAAIGLGTSLVTLSPLGLTAPILYPLATSALHIYTKFNIAASPGASLMAVFANYPLILAYYLGRLAGLFKPLPVETRGKIVNVCFDFEGVWGMPHTAEYDQEQTTTALLDVLDAHNCRATFFIVGALVEKYPDVVKQIAHRGHEIAIHGYTHERLNRLTPKQLTTFDEQLTRVENRLEQLIGVRPTGFRAPYLMAPDFYDARLYGLLERHGYTWASNHEVRFSEELFHPRRLAALKPLLFGKRNLNNDPLGKLLFLLINLPLMRQTGRSGNFSLMGNIRWLLDGSAPYSAGRLLEIPVYSPLDCDLIGLPKPAEQTEPALLEYFIESLSEGVTRPQPYYSVNVHDWIIGTGNRLEAFDTILGRLEDQGAVFGYIHEAATREQN